LQALQASVRALSTAIAVRFCQWIEKDSIMAHENRHL
jgi:hypothetical protein